jgi:hypothetical protein
MRRLCDGKENTMNCTTCQNALPDLLLNPAAAEDCAALGHIASCPDCAQELASLQATLSLLDLWKAPEISPYFDQKLAVRLREAQDEPAAGWFERLKTRLRLNTGRRFRPALAGAMSLLLLVGGGSFGIVSFQHPQQAVQPSAAVKDLQLLDKNEQALQQMDQVLQEDAPAADADNPLPRS